MESSKKKWIIIAVVAVALAAVLYFVGTNVSCDNASNKIEIVEEPSLKYRVSGNRFSPAVQVVVKNKTNNTLKLEMTCTVYASDGSVTTGLKSLYTTLVAGETATLTATTSYTYSPLYYSDLCASFGKVEYKFY